MWVRVRSLPVEVQKNRQPETASIPSLPIRPQAVGIQALTSPEKFF
jgi:hypothetical protein